MSCTNCKDYPIEEKISKFIECKEIGSGEHLDIFSQIDRELKLCEDIIKRPKALKSQTFDKEVNDDDLSNFEEQRQLTHWDTVQVNDNEEYSLEVYAVLLKIIAILIGFALKQSVSKMETINNVFCSWIGLLTNLKDEMKAKHAAFVEDYQSDCPRWCEFLRNPFKKVNFRVIFLCVPLILLVMIFMISNIFFTISKLLTVKIPIPRSLGRLMKNY